jgi:chaperonin GroES
MSAIRKLIPLLDRVLVEKVQALTKSAGGVLLPESALGKVNEGIVVSIGPGRRTTAGDLMPMSVKAGDKVLLPEYGGSVMKMDSKEYYLYRDEELLGILKD